MILNIFAASKMRVSTRIYIVLFIVGVLLLFLFIIIIFYFSEIFLFVRGNDSPLFRETTNFRILFSQTAVVASFREIYIKKNKINKQINNRSLPTLFSRLNKYIYIYVYIIYSLENRTRLCYILVI